MRGKSIALLMLALGCGLVAAIGITQVLAKRNTEPSNGVSMQPVLVAVRDIPMGRTIEPADVKVESWPQGKAPPGTLTKVEDAAGHLARGMIIAGEAIVDKKLRTNDFYSGRIPKGYRVVSVKVDNVSSSSGLILPGDRVDVLVFITKNPSQDIHETKTQTILQDIRVFAVNADVESDKDKDKNKGAIEANTISLLVTPKQAAKLTLASEMGRVRLVMRPQDDDARAENTSANPSELFDRPKMTNRRDEERAGHKTAETGRGSALDLLNDLKSRASKNPQPAARERPNTWTVRLIQPDSINEIVLEEDKKASKSFEGGKWRVSDTTTVATNVVNEKKEKPSAPIPAVAPPPLPPAPPAATQPDHAGEPKDAPSDVNPPLAGGIGNLK
jgi:pilus assembly protein CpaB